MIDKIPATYSAVSSKPPTCEEVYLRFRLLLHIEGNTGMPAVQEKAEACAITVLETEWWVRTGIKIIATCSIDTIYTNSYVVLLDTLFMVIQSHQQPFIWTFPAGLEETKLYSSL